MNYVITIMNYMNNGGTKTGMEVGLNVSEDIDFVGA